MADVPPITRPHDPGLTLNHSSDNDVRLHSPPVPPPCVSSCLHTDPPELRPHAPVSLLLLFFSSLSFVRLLLLSTLLSARFHIGTTRCNGCQSSGDTAGGAHQVQSLALLMCPVSLVGGCPSTLHSTQRKSSLNLPANASFFRADEKSSFSEGNRRKKCWALPHSHPRRRRRSKCSLGMVCGVKCDITSHHYPK